MTSRSRGGRANGLTSSPAQLASGSYKKSVTVRSRGVNSKSRPGLGIAERGGQRTETGGWVDEETDSVGDEETGGQRTVLTHEGRESSLVSPVEVGKVADKMLNGSTHTTTQNVRARPEKAPNVRVARSLPSLGAVTGQCVRQGHQPDSGSRPLSRFRGSP